MPTISIIHAILRTTLLLMGLLGLAAFVLALTKTHVDAEPRHGCCAVKGSPTTCNPC
jgi:hypothetical protein